MAYFSKDMDDLADISSWLGNFNLWTFWSQSYKIFILEPSLPFKRFHEGNMTFIKWVKKPSTTPIIPKPQSNQKPVAQPLPHLPLKISKFAYFMLHGCLVQE